MKRKRAYGNDAWLQRAKREAWENKEKGREEKVGVGGEERRK